MSERLTHQRSKGPVSTPAQRLVELQNALSAVERALDFSQARVAELQKFYDRFHTFAGVSFGGIPMAQMWADMLVWEGVLNENKLDAVFEIGTWQGGFSWWLWAQTEARGMFFETYDMTYAEGMPENRRIPGFQKIDVFAEADLLGKRFSHWEPCVVLCDNGNKPRELQTFAPYLTPLSLLAVHDWETEIYPEDVPATVEMVYGPFCEEIGSATRFFRPKETDAER